jgi:ABC-type proline/glycine betaine transport system ATPase subunit
LHNIAFGLELQGVKRENGSRKRWKACNWWG